jgi:hypothetical protein
MGLAARIARLERDVQRTCPHCQDWPEEVILEIKEIVISNREDAKALGDLLKEPEPWPPSCPQCGRPAPPVGKIVGHRGEPASGQSPAES